MSVPGAQRSQKGIKPRGTKVTDDCERDNYMSATEALNYGLIDEII